MSRELEITYTALKDWPENSYMLVDIRDSQAAGYGMIPGAVLIPSDELVDRIAELPENKKIVLYCMKGTKSLEVIEEMEDSPYEIYSLAGGYHAYLMYVMERDEEEEAERLAHIEKSIQKKFHKSIFSKFAKAINKYELLQEGDHVAVCISGGKDSMLMAKLFQELKRHNKFQFDLTFLVMDPGYSPENRRVIEQNARLMNIPLTIFESDIFDTVDNITKSPCYLCARMRRGYLYSRAKALGCNKIALGHH